jgi:lipopolysaccharide transport system ATP-binding protein
MDDVARGGRTVIFVTHNMAAVYRLATSAIWLDRGRLVSIGEPRAIIAAYLGGERRSRYVAERRTSKPQLLEAEACDSHGRPAARVLSTDGVSFRLRYSLPQPRPGLIVGVSVLSADGLPLFTSNMSDVGMDAPDAPGEYEATVTVPGDVLLVGEYHLAVSLWDMAEVFDVQEPAVSFAVEHGPSALYARVNERKGFVHIPCTWQVRDRTLVPHA